MLKRAEFTKQTATFVLNRARSNTSGNNLQVSQTRCGWSRVEIHFLRKNPRSGKQQVARQVELAASLLAFSVHALIENSPTPHRAVMYWARETACRWVASGSHFDEALPLMVSCPGGTFIQLGGCSQNNSRCNRGC
jgi:hypothetical protein